MTVNILAVDDSEANLYTLESLLSGYKIDNEDVKNINLIKAHSGEEALKIVLEKDIDLILLDIQMPGMDGFETAKFLKLNPKTKETPIVFLTAAFKSEEFVQKGYEVGATDYFTKPIEKYQFLNKINLYINLFAKTKRLQQAFASLEEESKKNRQQEKAMLEQSRLAQMGEMISMIAHQWRQPLGAIASTVVNLQMKQELEFFDLDTKEGQEESRRYFLQKFKDIDSYVQSLTTTIDDFRNFYKPNTETVSSTLDDLVEKAMDIIKSSLEAQNITIVCDYQGTKELTVFANELMQVILNILKNAQDNFIEKKTKEAQIVVVTSDCSIIICDNGGGIPEDIIGKIFDPYFSTKDERNGTGLGLYMSKTIVEEHHDGKLSVSNQYDDEGVSTGACFKIEIGRACNDRE